VREHAKGAYLPAIAVSARVRPDEAAAAIAAGFDQHIGKPVDFVQLLTAIDSVAGVRRGS
jgi:CheY-like chemotaxis protein